jgi:hypothetical protein
VTSKNVVASFFDTFRNNLGMILANGFDVPAIFGGAMMWNVFYLQRKGTTNLVHMMSSPWICKKQQESLGGSFAL